ncbi:MULTISPECIES: zinc ABC transporter permease subunit ZnuB [Marinomonas]|jgi:zinc transport system permease protein|uniref:High-affinity zinc uptake system membrane protein ZnuB n=1 Tax=Marinomonas arctica TaxID=383750 RepID=A0A7H1J770_9GAMM|nr:MULTISPECIES: zinc ABC transporter permease subunit ZnuB [Marinomonas]MCS7485732.1 membrane protein [Marinomonas sp. BSi20414]QNT06336.1 zinc ABC transporter permease subunit ZnuB [Marinomonas arctica]GGN28566.1 zinc transporter [Marinomonas arctica]
MLDLLLRALLGGLGVAAVAGPLGAFVVWRRMAYFGDTLAHSALLGVALGFLLDINLNLAIVVLCVGLALVLVTLQKKHIIATDTLLGILAHSALSLGLVAVSFLDNIRIDLMAYLFGDLLAINQADVYWIYGGGLAVITLLVTFWKPLLAVTVNEELAKVEGYPVEAIRLLLMLLVALVIAVAMKIVGVLLITSLMIIPAATARKLSSTPIQMASFASFIGCLSVCGGLWASYRWDTPTGPSVVVCAALLFLIAYTLPFKRLR